MTSQGQPEDGDHGCLCVPAQPDSFISQSPPARQQEDRQGQTAFIQSLYIGLVYIVQHGTRAHCLFYGPSLPTVTVTRQANKAPSPPSSQQQICLFLL